jgi:hypothetical protein
MKNFDFTKGDIFSLNSAAGYCLWAISPPYPLRNQETKDYV